MLEAFIASFVVALFSIIGVFFFGKKGKLQGSHTYILPISVGVFLGVVFFDLIPETIKNSGEFGGIAIATGFLSFYLLTHVLKTYHHHHTENEDGCVGTGAQKLLIGDAVHNIADGVVIASAFLINPTTGIAVTIGIILHEIPQEIAEFGVLLKSGYTRKKAVLLNLLSASSILIGVTITAIFASRFLEYIWIITGIAAGNLLYIAATDLLPELHESHKSHFVHSFTYTLFGATFIYVLLLITNSF